MNGAGERAHQLGALAVLPGYLSLILASKSDDFPPPVTPDPGIPHPFVTCGHSHTHGKHININTNFKNGKEKEVGRKIMER